MQITFPSLGDSPAIPGAALQQHPAYAGALRALGRDVRVAAFSCGGTPLGRAQFVLRRIGPLRLAWLPRGPLWHDAACPDQRAGALHLLRRAARMRALWAVCGDTPGPGPGWRAAPGPEVAELDLTKGTEALRAAMQGKWRNRLRHAERQDMQTVNRPLCLLRDAPLLMRELEQRRRQRYIALPPAFTAAWVRANPRSARLLAAARGKEVIAFIVLLLHGPVATYHIGWSGPEGRVRSAHNLLLWRACSWLGQNGYARLDLGRIDAGRAPGLTRFKLGCGAGARTLGPTMLSAALR